MTNEAWITQRREKAPADAIGERVRGLGDLQREARLADAAQPR